MVAGEERGEGEGRLPVPKGRQGGREAVLYVTREPVRPLPYGRTERTANGSDPRRERSGKGKLVLNDGHGFPFGSVRTRLRGGSCSRQSSAIDGNDVFRLD